MVDKVSETFLPEKIILPSYLIDIWLGIKAFRSFHLSLVFCISKVFLGIALFSLVVLGIQKLF